MSALRIGTRVEVCPYGEKRSFSYLGHLDGEIAEVEALPRFDKKAEQMKVMVRFSDGLGAVELPTKALKELGK